MIKYMVSFLLLANVMFAENAIVEEEKIIEVTQVYNPNVDCLILEDENSIICKFEVIRDTKDQQIVINWVSPTGEISRTREMNIPAGDVSAYDYRYLDGREGGKWNSKILYNQHEDSYYFELT